MRLKPDARYKLRRRKAMRADCGKGRGIDARNCQAGRAPKAAKMVIRLLEQLNFSLMQRNVAGKRLEPREHVVLVLEMFLKSSAWPWICTWVSVICQTALPVSRRSTSKVRRLQIAQHPEAEFDVVNEAPLEADDAMLRVVDHHVPLHGGEDAGFPVGRLKSGSGRKCSVVSLALLAVIVHTKALGKSLSISAACLSSCWPALRCLACACESWIKRSMRRCCAGRERRCHSAGARAAGCRSSSQPPTA